MKKFLLWLSLFLSFYSYGLAVGQVKVTGTVKKFNKKIVVLINKKGQKITLPRKAFKGKIKTGHKAHAHLKIEDLDSLLKKTTQSRQARDFFHKSRVPNSLDTNSYGNKKKDLTESYIKELKRLAGL